MLIIQDKIRSKRKLAHLRHQNLEDDTFPSSQLQTFWHVKALQQLLFHSIDSRIHEFVGGTAPDQDPRTGNPHHQRLILLFD